MSTVLESKLNRDELAIELEKKADIAALDTLREAIE